MQEKASEISVHQRPSGKLQYKSHVPLKTELIHHEDFQTREEAHQAIFEYIEVFYNRQRKHSTNGYLAPFVYEQKLAKAA